MPNRDLHSEPFRTMVVLGESHVAGMCATEERRRWVNVVADQSTLGGGTTVITYSPGMICSVKVPALSVSAI